MGIPDLLFFYTLTDLYEIVASYGAAGRSIHIRAALTIDAIWPLTYSGFLALWISWLYEKALSPDTPWRRWNVLPVFGLGFDLPENLSLSLVMHRYPGPAFCCDFLAPWFTLAKWILVVGSTFLLIMGSIMALRSWRKTDGNPP